MSVLKQFPYSYQRFIFSAAYEGALKRLLEHSCLGSQQVMVTGVTKCVSYLECSGFDGIRSVLGLWFFAIFAPALRIVTSLIKSTLPWS